MSNKALRTAIHVASSEHYPTTPQMMEFYEQVRRGDITRGSFQSYLRSELVKKPKVALRQESTPKKDDPVDCLNDWLENRMNLGEFGEKVQAMVLPFFDPGTPFEFLPAPDERRIDSNESFKEYRKLVTKALFWKKVDKVEFDRITKPSSERINFVIKGAEDDYEGIEMELRDLALAQQVQTRMDLDPNFLSASEEGIDHQFANLLWGQAGRRLEATGAHYYKFISGGQIGQIGGSLYIALRKMLAFARVGDKERAMLFAPFFQLQSSRWPVLYVSKKLPSPHSTEGFTAYSLSA